MNIEGQLQINLYPLSDSESRVEIFSSRPLQVVQVFEGKSPQQVLATLPLLYSVCGVAQATAATRAFARLLESKESSAVDSARTLLVAAETVREHLWRILLDWPKLLDEAVGAQRIIPIQALLQTLRTALFAESASFCLHSKVELEGGVINELIDHLERVVGELVFNEPLAQWLEIDDLTHLNRWAAQNSSVAARMLRRIIGDEWQAVGRCNIAPLPILPEEQLHQRLGQVDAQHFIAEPTWQQQCWETTPLARHTDHPLIASLRSEYGNGLLTRVTARLVELANLPEKMRGIAEQLASPQTMTHLPSDKAAIGQVEAARGRLVHRVILVGGLVSRYQVLAPTEWNFHPEGVVARGLAKLQTSDKVVLQRQAAMLIHTVDPCVGYHLKVH
ncbi:MAG: nickel-dependent hydrogenase large subunit [Gammaproteobacteria bacterium]|nr:nickel-dependent hydrogenase large subunit [Gammaproteobacteria bacterium]